jgi:hypothetical protein
MADDVHPEQHASGSTAAQDNPSHIHLPPNSLSPINVALSLTMCFIGTLSATWVWVIGLVWLIASLVAWYRGARNEFNELPEVEGQH